MNKIHTIHITYDWNLELEVGTGQQKKWLRVHVCGMWVSREGGMPIAAAVRSGTVASWPAAPSLPQPVPQPSPHLRIHLVQLHPQVLQGAPGLLLHVLHPLSPLLKLCLEALHGTGGG